MLTLNINKDSNNWFMNINIDRLSAIKYHMVKKISKMEWSKNKQYNTKNNKRICKSNSPQRKISLNEEWYLIPLELEIEKIIYQNHIKHGSI